MKLIIRLCTLAALVFILPSCGKKKGCMDPYSANYDSDAEEDDGSCTYVAGIGGNVTLVAKPEHHGNPIVSDSLYPDSVFIKFNTSNSPGTSAAAYDLVLAGEAGEDHVHVTGLKRGKYFVYMTGYDTAAADTVRGGIPYEITVNNGEVELIVPVTE